MCTLCAGLLYKEVRKGTQENKERQIKTQLTLHLNLLSETGLVVISQLNLLLRGL